MNRIVIDRETAAVIDRALNWTEGDSEDYRLGEDDTIVHTAVFLDGTEMDVKVCGTQYSEEDAGNNCAWTEAVLFRDGCEVACSEPSESFFGIWQLQYDNKPYIVSIERERRRI